MQTTVADLRAGWRLFRKWERRFRASFEVRSDNPDHLIFLANHREVRGVDSSDNASADALDRKIAFMKAYLQAAAIEARHFELSVRNLLKFQSRLNAPRMLGFWFYQSDPAKFGAGMSSCFQGDSIGMFCENVKQIDFSDISVIMPYDSIVVRNPKGNWTKRTAEKLVDHIKWDLACDGHETEAASECSADLLAVTLQSPDFWHLRDMK